MTPPARSPLNRFNPAQGGVTGMRIVATGMLVVMAITFVVAKSLQDVHPAWGFVRAFAEAAMVGGLADWFAVTALFRHPLGIPIPHTAIIPRNKDRIGDTLATFLRDNFLVPKVVARRMKRVDVAGAMGRFMSEPTGLNSRLREGVARLVANMLESLDQDRLGGMVKQAVGQRLRDLDVAPLLGQALSAAIADGRHVPLLDGIVRWGAKTLEANEHLIREMVHDRAGAIMRWTGLDEKLANAIIDGLLKMLDEMAADPEHPLRAKAEEGLETLADDLQHDPEMHARVTRIKAEILENPAMANWIEGLWEQARAALLRLARNPNEAMEGRFGDFWKQVGQSLLNEPRLRMTVNRFARRAAVGATASYGDGIVRLVSDTVRGWDAGTITDRLENAVGRDLQYIRVNGTLVGGLVGVTIHMIDVLV